MVELITLREAGQKRAERIRTLFHGPPGSGKTRIAGTCAKIGKCLFLDADGGIMSIAALYPECSYIGIEKYEDLALVINDLRGLESEETSLGLMGKYDWLVIDNLTEINHRIIENVSGGSPSKGDWQAIQGKLVKTVRTICKLDLNICITCLSDLKDGPDKNKMWMPLLTGKMSFQAPGFFDLVGFMSLQDEGMEVVFKVVTGKSTRYTARDRSDALEVLEEPDMEVIVEKIRMKMKGGEIKKNKPVEKSKPETSKAEASSVKESSAEGRKATSEKPEQKKSAPEKPKSEKSSEKQPSAEKAEPASKK